MTFQEPTFDIAHLAHIELFTPKLEESLWFFKNITGMIEVEREGLSVYLRCYEDHYHHSLKLSQRDKPGMGYTAFRTWSPQALERCAERIEKTGLGKGWVEGGTGHGKAYDFRSPEGQNFRILFDVDYYEAPEAEKSKLITRPHRRPLNGIPSRRLDHVNVMVQDVAANRTFFEDNMGFKMRENIELEDGTQLGGWMSTNPLVHELAFMGSPDARQRLHHIAFWYGNIQHLCDMAEIMMDYDIKIEAGPGKHGASQAQFMYVIEPGGNRVELFGDHGYLILDPTWKLKIWRPDDPGALVWYGSNLPEEFHLYGTPND